MPKKPSDPHRRRLLKLDEEFRLWLSYQPSCIDGSWSEWDGEAWRSIACHVRRVPDCGVGIKPLFSAVPMSFSQHAKQHQLGETALLPQAEFEARAGEYVARWLETVSPEDVAMVREEIER